MTGNLARGDLSAVSGIIVHQTVSDTAAQTLQQYNGTDSNGAHFLIAKDGTIYQTASLYKMTYHVGRLRSKCVAEGQCEPTSTRTTSDEEIAYIRGLGPRDRHALERTKPAGQRYPSNTDAIGIELVGNTIGPDPAHPGELLFETVTAAQNRSLTWLVDQITIQFGLDMNVIYRHPTVSQKTPSEASTANWQVRS
ncbi:N-acetylmuramoyl-L-alanine amidase [Marivita sp. S0852]